VAVVVVDTSIWIDFFRGIPCPALEESLKYSQAYLSPVVAAELLSGTKRISERESLKKLFKELPLIDCPLNHWVKVGELRQRILVQGENITIPDCHIAQCAIELEGFLLTKDAVFKRISKQIGLKFYL
jgi:tRNA(fMet)-specific endonuclease VapC